MSSKETFFGRFSPLTLAWAILVAATGIGWWFGHASQIGDDGARIFTAGVIVTAFFKAWLVGFQFMELKLAPRWLRCIYDLWIVGVCAALIFICLR